LISGVINVVPFQFNNNVEDIRLRDNVISPGPVGDQATIQPYFLNFGPTWVQENGFSPVLFNLWL
jgi:hypothetical protein